MSRLRLSLLVLASLVVPLWALFGQHAASAQSPAGPPALFTSDTSGRAAALPPHASRARTVDVDFRALGLADSTGKSQIHAASALAGSALKLDLFTDVSYTAIRDKTEQVSATHALLWTGTLSGVPNSNVSLSVIDGTLAGTVFSPQGQFAISNVGNGLHQIMQVDQRSFPAEFDDDSVEPPAPVAPPPVIAIPDNGTTIDAMVLWTPAARIQAGGTAQMQQVVTQSIATTNTAYANSNINFRVRLVYSAEETYTESGDFGTDLGRLTTTNDGYMDDVLGLRNLYGADVVSLLIATTSSCGLAWLDNSLQSTFESNAYSVVSQSCANGNLSLAHEMGHNEAARHDWFVDPTDNSPYHYNHGYTDPSFQFRTVMAYANECGSCPRIPYFSNPALQYTGLPLGTTAEPHPTDNHTVLNNTAVLTSNFRQSVVAAAPVVTGLSPTHGPAASQSAVAISGTNLSVSGQTTSVTFGGNAAIVNSCTAIVCNVTAPTGTAGLVVDVIVTVGTQSSTAVNADHFTYDASVCTGVTLAPNLSSPQTIGAVVTFTATLTPNGCNATGAAYVFYLFNPNLNTWVQQSSNANVFSWSTSGLQGGTYGILVYATPAGGSQLQTSVSFTLNASPCTGVSLSVNPPSGATVGTPVAFTATPAGCQSAYYLFYLYSPFTDSWTAQGGWTLNPVFSWTTTGVTPGNYGVQVLAIHFGGSAVEQSASLGFTLASAACSGLSVTPSPASGAAVGTAVNFTATPTGCQSAYYLFYLYDPSLNTWAPQGGWTLNPVFHWSTTGLSPNYYAVQVLAIHFGGSTVDQTATTPFLLASLACSSIGLAGSPAGGQTAGQPVTVTATPAGCTKAYYYFYGYNPHTNQWVPISTSWTLSPQIAWQTTGLTAGTYGLLVQVVPYGTSTVQQNSVIYPLN